MTDIEQKARDMVLEVLRESELPHEPTPITREYWKALCRAIEQHEAFRQEVSFALKTFKDGNMHTMHDYLLEPFIIPTDEPDPLVEVLNEISHEGGFDNFNHYAYRLRAALEARGLEIRSKAND
jgi:hypothetical protein